MVREARARMERRKASRAQTKSPLTTTANTIVHGDEAARKQTKAITNRLQTSRSMAVNKIKVSNSKSIILIKI